MACTFECVRARSKTCCFINGDKIWGLNRSTTTTVRFHTPPLRLSIYVLYTKRHLLLKQGGDKATVNFRETKFKPVSKPVASSTPQQCRADHFDNRYMAVCDLSLQQGNTESRKYIEQRTVLSRLILQLFSRYHVFTNSVARLSNIQVNHRPNGNYSIRSIEATAKVNFFELSAAALIHLPHLINKYLGISLTRLNALPKLNMEGCYSCIITCMQTRRHSAG